MPLLLDDNELQSWIMISFSDPFITHIENMMTLKKFSAILLTASFLLCMNLPSSAQSAFDYEAHDMDRAQPPVVDSGAPAAQPVPAPSDAIVLFDGNDLSAWIGRDGQEPQWDIRDGYMEVVPGTGEIRSRQQFGDVQLYIEWATPVEVDGDGQGRGNSGVFLMDDYEIQVLDSYDNETYPDGQAASVYGQYPPLVNVSRAPGEWQSYNIIFRRPQFDPNGNLREPARVTVIHNNVVVQDNVPLIGPTGGDRASYEVGEDEGSIRLQDHSDLVRFRNVWVRELSERRE